MKKTLLAIVQSILNDMDSDSVNSISDTVESEQVARVVQTVYENMIATRTIPEHNQLLKLTAASDSAYPTHFSLDDDVKEITVLWYQNSDGDYVEIEKKDPLEFLYLTDRVESNYTTVYDKNAGTSLRIVNNEDPTYFTSFDDYWVVLNAHKSTVDSTLQESKTRAYGTVYPTFSMTDTYVPVLDSTMFPYLEQEAKSLAMSLFKGGADPKTEQWARRNKSYKQNDMYRTQQGNKWNEFGR